MFVLVVWTAGQSNEGGVHHRVEVVEEGGGQQAAILEKERGHF